MPTVIPAAR